MSTQIAIVLGAQVAGFVAALYAPDGRVYDMTAAGLLMGFFAVLGLVPAFLIPRLAPQSSACPSGSIRSPPTSIRFVA